MIIIKLKANENGDKRANKVLTMIDRYYQWIQFRI